MEQAGKVCAVVLAAGDGKRMRSARSKVMCRVLDRPMIGWVAAAVRDAGLTRACAVVSAQSDQVRAALPAHWDAVVQREQLGTGHAASMAAEYIRKGGFDDVIVLYGDAPLVGPEDLAASLEIHRSAGNDVTVLTAPVDNPAGYGRVVRDGDKVAAIVEQADADEATRQIKEINSGIYWFRADFLLRFFGNMTRDNAQGEYYLTDAVAYAVRAGDRTGAAVVSPDAVLGANDRKALALLNRIARDRILDRHYANGVDIPFPEGVLIGPDVAIGPDTVILPGTVLKGSTQIGAGCEIGPNSYLEDAVIGDNCRVLSTYIEASTLEPGVKIGPMSNVRPGSTIRSGVKIGDFVEIKNSDIGPGTAVAHLTYVGDSDVGGGCNIGCGVVTSNYDGTTKSRTIIGNNAFIGCNTNLVAPVRVGDRAYSAAGTTITEDVPDDALVIGRARQVIKEGWAARTGRFVKKPK